MKLIASFENMTNEEKLKEVVFQFRELKKHYRVTEVFQNLSVIY